MKLLLTLKEKFGALSKAIVRFLGTFLFLVAIAVLNAISIQNNHDFTKQIISLVLGVFCFITFQVLFERFWKMAASRILLMLGAAAAAACCYLLIRNAIEINVVIGVRIIVLSFALFLAFIWIPSIRKSPGDERTDFNSVFMSVFKAIFTSAFFSAIIWGGISAIIAAIDTLLISIDERAYIHTINIIWVVWAPMLFLSLVPVFNGNEADSEKIKKASSCPKFFEILLSYVLIPLISVYTLVLLIYIAKTIFIQNWSDNLLEPLVLSYCIALLLLYVLTSNLTNKLDVFFRRVFPKFLVPIALFQIVSSSIVVSSTGLVYARYFVLIFCAYAVVTGILLWFIPTKKNGWIAILAIIAAVICITPPIDAFSLSRSSQVSILETTLEKNDMLKNGIVVSNANISDGDKTSISRAVFALNDMDYLDSVSFLPNNFNAYSDFEKTFGFIAYNSGNPGNITKESYYNIDKTAPVGINGYSYFYMSYVNIPGSITNQEICSVIVSGKTYRLTQTMTKTGGTISIVDENGTQLLTADVLAMFKGLLTNTTSSNGMYPVEQMTFDVQNSKASLRIIFQNAFIDSYSSSVSYGGDIYLLFSIK